MDKEKLWSANVWGGILNNQIISPYFISDTLNEEKYALFLQNKLQMFIYDMLLDTCLRMWY